MSLIFPKAVIEIVKLSDLVVSPPTTAAFTKAASSQIPSTSSINQSTLVVPGMAKPISNAVGVAPVATMSAKFAAAARCPISLALDQSLLKC